MHLIAFDEDGNCLNGSFMDYLIPTSMEVPDFELGHTVTPSPHHPIGAKGVGESPNVGSPPAIVNAICDALDNPPHGHAVLARSRVGGQRGAPGAAGVSPAMTTSEIWRAADELAVARRPFVAGDRRAPPAAVERASGRRRDRAPGRPHRGLRGRRVRDVDRPPARPAGPRDRGAHARPHPPRRRRRAGRGRRRDRGQPVSLGGRDGDLPRAATAGARDPGARRLADRPRARPARRAPGLRGGARRRARSGRRCRGRGRARRRRREPRGGRAARRRAVRRPRRQPEARRPPCARSSSPAASAPRSWPA